MWIQKRSVPVYINKCHLPLINKTKCSKEKQNKVKLIEKKARLINKFTWWMKSFYFLPVPHWFPSTSAWFCKEEINKKVLSKNFFAKRERNHISAINSHKLHTTHFFHQHSSILEYVFIYILSYHNHVVLYLMLAYGFFILLLFFGKLFKNSDSIKSSITHTLSVLLLLAYSFSIHPLRHIHACR